MKEYYVYPDSIPWIHLGRIVCAEDEESAIKQAEEAKYFEGYQGNLRTCAVLESTGDKTEHRNETIPIEIKLKDNESGYSVIGEYIRRYWNNVTREDVVVSIATSHDGIIYSNHNEVAHLINFDDIEFLCDWWEGEKYIKLFGIRAIDMLYIFGGIYRE